MSETVRIGLSISTRNSGAADTLPTYRGFLLAMEHVEKMTDLPVSVEWEMLDDFGDPEQSAKLATETVADPSFVAVVGPMGSTEAFANAPIFNEAGLLQVSPCGSHPDLCRMGFSTFYRLVPNEQVQGTELARIARSHLGASRAAIVHDADAFGTTVSDNFTAGYEELGGEIVIRLSFEQGTDEYENIAKQIAASDVDVVFFAVHGLEGGLASSAIRAQGVTVPFLGTDGLKTSFFLGGGEPDGEAYHTHSGADFNRMPTAAEFRDEYVSRWPADSTYSPEAYDSAMLVIEAIRRAEEPTRAGVFTAFKAMESFDGITGTVRFDENGERRDAPVSFYRVEKTDDGLVMAYKGVTTDLA